MKRIWASIQAVSVWITFTLLLFVGVNLAAYGVFSTIQRKGPAVHADDWFIAPLSPEGQEILERIHGRRDPALFLSLFNQDPSIRPHPVLAFTEGLSTSHYRIGWEGMRYEPEWEDAQVEVWMQRESAYVYVLGGSTAFGHGVAGDQTLTAALNRLSGEVRYLNLAVQAYDSIRETDKLIYLLRKGYRPLGVVFLDGLNDVTTFSWSNYPAHDKPRTQGLWLDRGQVGLVFGFPRRRNMLAAFLFSLPVVQLAARWQAPEIVAGTYSQREPAREPMDWQQLSYFYDHWDLIQVERRTELAMELVDYHRENLAFLRQLGDAFGFWVEVIYQPIGLLDSENPFLKQAFFQSPVHAIYQAVDQRLREEIEAGRLDLIDCSRALRSGQGLAYVDSTHYSPQGNALLARCVADRQRGTGSLARDSGSGE